MPGVLKRTGIRGDSEGVGTAMSEKSGAMPDEGTRKRKVAEMLNGGAQLNGDPPAINGVYTNGIVADPSMSPDQLGSFVDSISSRLPPEIEHITLGFRPLSRLITRLAQDTFNGLTEVINELADMELSQKNGVPQQNGAASNPASQINVQKKTRLWDFAQEQRAKFIKVLVLSQWSRQSEDVSKVIDLNVWMTEQRELYKRITLWMGELRRVMGVRDVKIPSPDLVTALEVLSTGKAAWLPDLGYLRPEPLSPEQLLKVLRTINTLLTIRLNLHDTIPPFFKNFVVASGRVTFRVEDEFELDLSIADEDPSSQFFFIDFRFLFSPCMTEIPEGHIRNEIEGRTNDILKREGLAGCYEYFHDLVLTHKIHILTTQAEELARGRWSEDLLIERVHRSVVVQYWLNRPGGKNWLEIGIKRGKPERRLFPLGTVKPEIFLRWHRHGKEVLDHGIQVDLGDLSVEWILKEVISLHTNYIFHETKRRLRESPIYSKKLLSLKHRASATEPTDCSLRLDVTGSSEVKIIQEPVSGAFALIPPSSLHGRVERDLNSLRDPAVEASSRIAHLRCAAAIEQAEECTRMLGWRSLRTYNPSQEVVKSLFGADVLRLSFFKHRNWNERWILAITTSMSGDSWWVVETKNTAKAPDPIDITRGPNQLFQTAIRVPITAPEMLVIDPTYSVLSKLENTAAVLIAQQADCRELGSLSIHYIQHNPTKRLDKLSVPDLFLYHKDRERRAPWCREVVKMSFRGLSRSQNSVNALICGRLVTPIQNIDKLTPNMDTSIMFHPTSGAFAFRLSTPLGESCIPAVLERFRRIERLVRFLEIIKRYDLQCETISLSNLTFTYAIDPACGALAAKISFASDMPMAISFAQRNPHLRIQDFLASLLNISRGFETVILVLQTTLPLLQAFESLESAERKPGSEVQILPRSATWHRVRYENPALIYEIRLQQRNDQPSWYSVAMASDSPSMKGGSTNLAARTWESFCRDKGPGWQGMTDGIKAEIESVGALLFRIDEALRDVALNNTGPAEQKNGVQENLKQEKNAEVVVLD